MDVIGRLWRGEFTLPKTFWGFYVGGIFLAFIVGTGITVAANRMHFFAQGFIVAIVLLYSYGFIATVGVWQSARAEIKSPAWMNREWGWAARSAKARPLVMRISTRRDGVQSYQGADS